MSLEKNSQNNDIDMFKILIASDCHLGYNEKHPIRGDDSFRTFEEVLKAAAKHDVDFILLAGDLFHVNRPSVQTMRRAMSLIRKYCFGGDGQRKFSVKNFKNSNYLDPNIKVRYPIFTIHGNHDDPIGMERACCLDLFSTSGLVNYFGKEDQVEKLALKPIIFEKGVSKIMVFGFGSMREERLHHLIQTNHFNYLTPEFQLDSNTEEELKKYFKILLVHQNRVPRPNMKHLNPYDLSDLPDLVIWGHEHKPIIETEYFEQNRFFILQPGSTVATSLCDSEHGDKYYYILNYFHDKKFGKTRFKTTPYRCETVRPFLLATIDVDQVLSKKNFKSSREQQQYLYTFCKSETEQMISEGRCQSTLQDDRPLIRLRLEYQEKDHLFDKHQFESKFNSMVANTDDIIRFVKKRKNNKILQYNDDDDDVDFGFVEMIDSIDYEVALKKIHVKSVMDQHYETLKSNKQRLGLYDEKFFNEKLIEYVEKNCQTTVFKDFMENTKQAIRTVMTNEINEELNYSMQDLREQIIVVKRKIEHDQQYRKLMDWITKEPYIKRNANQLKQKVNLSVLALTKTTSVNDENNSNYIEPSSTMNDPSYDIHLFDDFSSISKPNQSRNKPRLITRRGRPKKVTEDHFENDYSKPSKILREKRTSENESSKKTGKVAIINTTIGTRGRADSKNQEPEVIDSDDFEMISENRSRKKQKLVNDIVKEIDLLEDDNEIKNQEPKTKTEEDLVFDFEMDHEHYLNYVNRSLNQKKSNNSESSQKQILDIEGDNDNSAEVEIKPRGPGQEQMLTTMTTKLAVHENIVNFESDSENSTRQTIKKISDYFQRRKMNPN